MKNNFLQKFLNKPEEVKKDNLFDKLNVASLISQEIRVPLNAIVGISDLILKQDLSPKVYEYSLSLRNYIMNMVSIINDLSDIGLLQRDKLELAHEPVEMSRLTENICEYMTRWTSGKALYFVMNIDPDVPASFYSDFDKLRQILLNLLSNAVKYTEKGAIELQVKLQKPSGFGGSPALNFIVRDSGIGIEPDKLEGIFDVFYHEDREKYAQKPGMGLGLAIVKGLAKLMDAPLLVRSVLEKGTEFTLSLKLEPASDARYASLNEPQKLKVLVYENRAPYADSLIYSLSALGVDYVCAKDVMAFCANFEKEQFTHIFVASHLTDSVNDIIKDKDSSSYIQPKDLKYAYITGNEMDVSADGDYIVMPADVHDLELFLSGQPSARSIDKMRGNKYEFYAPDARILVVDDFEINVEIIRETLNTHNINSDSAPNGKEAVDKASLKYYDMIFMDYMMPVIDGAQAAKILREKGYRGVIVGITANVESATRSFMVDSGMDDILFKPIEMTEIQNKLLKWLPQRKILKKSQMEIDKVSAAYDISTHGDDENIALDFFDFSDEPSVVIPEVVGQRRMEKAKTLKNKSLDRLNDYDDFRFGWTIDSAFMDARHMKHDTKATESLESLELLESTGIFRKDKPSEMFQTNYANEEIKLLLRMLLQACKEYDFTEAKIRISRLKLLEEYQADGQKLEDLIENKNFTDATAIAKGLLDKLD